MSAPLLSLTAAFAFAVSAILLKRGLQYASPLAAAVISVTFTAVLVWATALAGGGVATVGTWRVLPFVVAGAVAPGLARLLLFTGIARVGVARASSLVSATPLFAVVIAALALGERPSVMLLAGVALVAGGAALLVRRVRAEPRWRRRDLAYPLAAALAFGIRDNITRWGLRSFPEPVVAAAVATLASVAVMWLFAGLQRRPARWEAAGLGFLVLTGLTEGFAFLTMWRALAVGDVSVVSPLVHAQSFFTVALAAVFLRDLERVTWRIAAGAVLIVGGVVLVIRFGTA